MLHIRIARAALLSIAAMTLTAAASTVVVAQQPPQATIALVDALADSTALATIVRSPGPNSHTTILLRERDATAATLASAMVFLFDSRRRHGEQPESQVVINLHGQKRLESLAPNERELAGLYLARLRAAKIEEVEGVGRARATTIPLGPAREPALK